MNVNNNIENSAAVTNLIAASISKLNLNSVKVPEFSLNQETKQDKKPEEVILPEEEAVIPNDSVNKSVDVDDIQKYAQMVGEKVSVDDINYGIMYGRSVIADYIA